MNWKDIDLLTKIVKESKTQKEILIKLKLRAVGSNYKSLKKYINLYKLDTSHFIKNYDKMVNLSKFKKIPIERILVEHSSFNRTHLKERLFDDGLKKRVCELCGQDEWWYGKKMSLILDHINGIGDDHRFENLRIVCPNCNATLDTHCGKNKNRYQEIIEKNIRKKQYRIKSSMQHRIKSSMQQRKVERPSYEQLKKEIDESNYSAIGRKYGVTDTSIRKWIKFYEKYNI